MKNARLSRLPGHILVAVCLCWFGSPSAFAQKLYSVDRSSARLRELNPTTAATISSVSMTLPGRTISGAVGLAADPTTGKFYALLRLQPFVAESPSVRELVTVDVTTGVVTDIGVAGGSANLAFADIAFDGTGTLYGVTGNGSAQGQQLFILNKTTGAASLFMGLGNGNDGEAIGFNPENGLLYHASGKNEPGTVPPPANLYFESINLATKAAPTRIPLAGAAIQEAAALTYAGNGAFIWSRLDFGTTLSFALMRVTTAGVITQIGVTDHLATGLAYVPAASAGNPLPAISSITPAVVAANSGAFTLTVTGSGFVAGTTVQWNGAGRPTTFVSSAQVTAAIAAADVATAGTAQVTVVNPAPGGGTSAPPQIFSIAPPASPLTPTVRFITPLTNSTHPTEQNIAFTLAVSGSQSIVTDYLVTTGGNTLTLQRPTVAGVITSGKMEGWDTMTVQARDAAGGVVASGKIDIFLARPYQPVQISQNFTGPTTDVKEDAQSCIVALLQSIAKVLGSSAAGGLEPPRAFPARQALLSVAADVVDLDLAVYRAFRDNLLSASPAGRYYINAYERSSFALIEIVVREPAQALASYQMLVDWTPAVRALLNGQGDTVTITPTMAAQVQTLLTNLRRSATGELAALMDTEIAALNPSSWSGLKIGQVLARVESQPRTPPTLLAPGRISNMSIRSSAGTGAQTLIVGAVIGGQSPLSTKPLLIRGVGPALTAFGVPGALADPILNVFAGTNVVASNDNWGGNAQVTTVGNSLGAFALAPATSRDAALYAPALAPRDYTIQITGTGGATGVALAEIYDATPTDSFTRTRPQLVNVSARTEVGTGADILIAGFTLSGDTPRKLLIRAVGPTLGVFGVTGALADPQLALFRGENRLQENNDWGAAANAAEIATTATQLGAFQLGAGARDSAILTTLQPGSYTAQISGVGNTTGVALVEIYVVP